MSTPAVRQPVRRHRADGEATAAAGGAATDAGPGVNGGAAAADKGGTSTRACSTAGSETGAMNR